MVVFTPAAIVVTEVFPTLPSTTDSEPVECHPNARLVWLKHDEICVCNPGYSGDGVNNCDGKQAIAIYLG